MPKAITKIPKIKKGKGRGRGVNIKSNYQKIKVVVNTGDKDTGKGNSKNTPPYHTISNTTTYIPTPINNTIPSTNTIPTTTPLEDAMTNLLKTFTPKTVQVQNPIQSTNPKIGAEEQNEKRKPTRMKVPILVSSNLKEKQTTNPISQVLRGDAPSPPPQMDNIPFMPSNLMDAIRRRGRPPDSEDVKQKKQEEKKQMNELKKRDPELYQSIISTTRKGSKLYK